jgi:8-oxo-dGTP diphosphatase
MSAAAKTRIRSAAVIFHIRSTNQLMFYIRSDNTSIPFPNMLDIIGGHVETGESPRETALREVAEELDDLNTGQPFVPPNLTLFKSYVDSQGFEQNVFSCELEKPPNLRLNEGQHLVFLRPEDATQANFAFHFNAVVREYVARLYQRIARR